MMKKQYNYDSKDNRNVVSTTLFFENKKVEVNKVFTYRSFLFPIK